MDQSMVLAGGVHQRSPESHLRHQLWFYMELAHPVKDDGLASTSRALPYLPKGAGQSNLFTCYKITTKSLIITNIGCKRPNGPMSFCMEDKVDPVYH